MTIREITVGDLIDFINSKEYFQLEPKPITPGRAVSQAKNPIARAEDSALVYVSENNKLLAFAGILTDEAGGGAEPVFSNTGWWIHKDLGRKYGLTVFIKAFQRSNRRMFFTDCSEYTKSILEKTGLFTFHKPAAGVRFILNFYSGDFLRRKRINGLLSKFFSTADFVLNYLLSFRIKKWRNENLPQNYSIGLVNKIDEELDDFIKKHSSDYFLKQSKEKLNWIIQYPWIVTGKNAPLVSYPFSQIAESFNQKIVVVKKAEIIVAVLLLSIRDHHASIPYIYYSDSNLQDIVIVILNLLYQQKVNSLITFQPEVLKMLDKIKIPLIFKKSIYRYSGYSKELSSIFSGDKRFQDGEGDVAFT